MKTLSCLLFSVLFASSSTALAQINLSPTPTRAIGQDDLLHGAANLVEGREFNGPIALALDTSVSPPALYVSDLFNNRVLGFKNAASFANGQKADIVIGQLDFLSSTAQGPGSVASGGRSTGLAFPTGLLTDSKGNLYVIDTGNNRILRFPTPFTHPTQFPDLVIGQTSFSTSGGNTGGASAKTLKLTTGTTQVAPLAAYLAFDSQGNLWVADAGNNRILRYNAASIGSGASNGPAADIVLGQTDFVTTTYNNPSNDPTNLNALNEPTGIVFDNEGRLYVSESSSGARGRILIYNGALSIGTPASRIIGVVPSNVNPQPPPISEQQLGAAPGNLFLINDGVAICDTSNHRILIYPPASQFTSNNLTQQAVAVIGQKNFSVGAPNQGQPQTDASSLAAPQAAFATATEIYIADYGNSRVIVMPYTGTGASTVAGAGTRLLGQDQFYLNSPNLVEGREFNFSNSNGAFGGIAIDSTATPPHLYIADTLNNRILGFKDIRNVSFGAKADIVIGQPDLQRTVINYPAGDPTKPNASGLYFPIGLTLDSSGNLYVADNGNSRVVRFPTPFANPTTLPAADLVLGQFSLTGPTITDASANTMSAPYGLAFAHQNGLLVSDAVHNRVLYFPGTSATFTSGMAATKVFGQPNFTSTVSSTTISNRFNSSRGIATDADDQLYVADSGNGRIAIFSRVTSAGPDPIPGNSLIGTTVSTSGGSLTIAMTSPEGVWVNATTGEIWVADSGAGYLLRYPQFNTLPLNNFAPNYILQNGGAPLANAQDSFGDLFTVDSLNRVTINYPALAFVNAASLYPSLPLAPGAIGSIFGFINQFTTTAQAASALPLPTQMQNVEVLVGGTPAPIFYLGNNQINFQVPSSTATTGTVEVTVQRTDTGQILGDSPLAMDTVAPALFTLNGSGQGQVVALNQDNTVNGPNNPATNGSVIQFFGTGQGIVPNMPADGTAASGLTPTPYTPTVIIGSGATNNPLPASYVQYSGLAPGLVGVWQINALIPNEVAPTLSSPGQQTRVAIGVNGSYSTGLSSAVLVTTIWVKQPGK
jgi:uncharacterized protein (TIGR03437 family)